MYGISTRGAHVLSLLLAVLGLHACTARSTDGAAAPPHVGGLGDPALDARGRGLVLLAELGCANCHPGGAGVVQADARRGPDLVAVGDRVRADYLPRFLAEPHRTKPGTTMPDVLRKLEPTARAGAADALTHYLLSFTERAARSDAPDPVAAVRGRRLFHEVGCVACHAPRDDRGVEVSVPGSIPLGDLAPKYHVEGLRAFLLAPRLARPSARMPDLRLTPGEAHDLTSFLLAGREPTPATTPRFVLDPAKVSAGRALFAERGCASCHRLDDPERAATADARVMSALEPTRGCTSGSAGGWPAYDLTDAQRSDLSVALRSTDAPQSDEQRLRQLLASRNCTACHQRGEFGGPSAERGAYFTTLDVALGPAGRVPPPLTGVGAKLQHDWLVDAIAHGQAERPYQLTRMPGFDDALAAELAELFARVDALPPVEITELPADRKAAREVTELGRVLVGEKGMGCITCHAFAGEHVGAMSAVDLVDTTAERLRPGWFREYLQQPSRFRPDTLMPQFFVDGVSTRPELGDGDVVRQIDSIWHYLAEGRNVRKPDGMRQPPIELLVGDEAVVLRRSVQNTGKRGISVGYPLGVNLTFDAESLGINQVWWGEFVDAAPVWYGQGSGEARLVGRDRVTLPKGPAFVSLPDPSTPWPAESRRDLGQQFLGYDLDAQQRPTFRYVCEGVTIHDAPVDVAVEGGGEGARPLLRRTLTCTGPVDQTLYFRAAVDARVEELEAGTVQVGDRLRMHLAPASFVIRTAGEERELLVAIAVVGGRAEQVIEYQWVEESR